MQGGVPLLNLPSKTANMEQSKKGACSSNTQTAKANCLVHNRRDNSTEKVPSYVNQNRSHLNRTIFEDELIKGRKSIVPLIHAAEKLYTEKTGQKCQKSFAPFREACLHLKEGITDEQLLDFKAKVEQETKWKVIGIWLHEDEGHAKSKYIEGEEGFEINHHAHVLFSCQDLTTGKAIRADRKKLSKMQDILAEATGMERGNKASETGRRHRSAMEQRIYIQEQRIAELEECAKEMEMEVAVVEEKRKELWKEFSFVSKKKKEQSSILYSKTKELEKVNLSLSNGLKDLSAIISSLEDKKTLRAHLNGEIENLKANARALEEKISKCKDVFKETADYVHRTLLLRELINGSEKGIHCIIDLYTDPYSIYFSSRQKQEITEVIGEGDITTKLLRAKELVIAASKYIISQGLAEENKGKDIKGQIEAIARGEKYMEHQSRGKEMHF
ncbi:hypothetical protein SAG0070_10725 [Streptococcus agalactiae CCUG 44077]|nr:hypothetical protein SAG0070_10725 [Streptococcus agalactiae CCUG 44077]EPW35246.1 hypothetical protein SAG0068_10915 [Streptococcus agalactiae CCUG 44050]